MTEPNKIKVVYVSPMGHSGSTLLDLMLNQHPQLQSVGEVLFIKEWIEEGYNCSCGKSLYKCSFWGDIISKLENVSHLQVLFNSWGDNNSANFRKYNASIAKYTEATKQLLQKVVVKSGKEIIIDSSKSLGRLKALALSGEFELNVIHLIRNGLGYVNSLRTPLSRPSINESKKTKTSSIVKSTIRWRVRNLSLEKIARVKPDIKYYQLRYEDLCIYTDKKMQEVCDFIGINYVPEVLTPGLGNIHNIGGSRWRYSSKPIEIKLDEKWKGDLNKTSKIIFNLLSGKLNKKYGY